MQTNTRSLESLNVTERRDWEGERNLTKLTVQNSKRVPWEVPLALKDFPWSS